VADALPQPAVAARHQRDRALKVHVVSPACGGVDVVRRLPVFSASV
jgi:hypothetical protein